LDNFQVWMRVRLTSWHSNLSWVVFTAQMRARGARRMRTKELKRWLSSPCPKSFQAWMRVRRLKSQHSTYPGLFSRHGWEPNSARPISELFHNGWNNPTDPAPMLDKTHEDIKQRARQVGDTQLKGTWIRLQRLRFISSTYLKNLKV
jgi:hypothetical protein